MSETIKFLLATRPWVAHIDDERHLDNSIIVTLAAGYEFADDKGCGVKGFDKLTEVVAGTTKKQIKEMS